MVTPQTIVNCCRHAGAVSESTAVENEDPTDDLPLVAFRDALRQLGESNPEEEALAFLEVNTNTTLGS